MSLPSVCLGVRSRLLVPVSLFGNPFCLAGRLAPLSRCCISCLIVPSFGLLGVRRRLRVPVALFANPFGLAPRVAPLWRCCFSLSMVPSFGLPRCLAPPSRSDFFLWKSMLLGSASGAAPALLLFFYDCPFLRSASSSLIAACIANAYSELVEASHLVIDVLCGSATNGTM